MKLYEMQRQDFETEDRQKRLAQAQEFNRAWFWCGLTGTILVSALCWWGLVHIGLWIVQFWTGGPR